MIANRRLLASVIGIVLSLAACSAEASTPSPSAPPAASAASVASPAAIASTAPSDGASAASQTQTDWGRIWDSLPSDFPTYPGAQPGDESATGPASADLVVTGVDAKGIATTLQTKLQTAGYTTAGLAGPLEDGGYVLDMTGSPTGCMLQIRATPTGSLTRVTILYGAACPQS